MLSTIFSQKQVGHYIVIAPFLRWILKYREPRSIRLILALFFWLNRPVPASAQNGAVAFTIA